MQGRVHTVVTGHFRRAFCYVLISDTLARFNIVVHTSDVPTEALRHTVSEDFWHSVGDLSTQHEDVYNRLSFIYLDAELQ